MAKQSSAPVVDIDALIAENKKIIERNKQIIESVKKTNLAYAKLLKQYGLTPAEVEKKFNEPLQATPEQLNVLRMVGAATVGLAAAQGIRTIIKQQPEVSDPKKTKAKASLSKRGLKI